MTRSTFAASAIALALSLTAPPAVAQTATPAAALLGLDKEVGTIEPGESADIVAVAGNLLSDVKVLKIMKFVMARGTVVVGP